MTQPKSRKRKKTRYSKGELNRMIDGALHPFFVRNSAFIIIDTVLHGLVEKNPPESIRKFVRYSLPTIIEEILKNL